MIIKSWATYGGMLLMDIIDLPQYQQVEFIPLEHDIWQVHDLEVEEAELHHGGRSSPISKIRSGPVHLGGDMSMVMRGVTDHVGRYAMSDVGGNAGHGNYFYAPSPPATVKPTFVEKAPVDSSALSDIDRLEYFTAAGNHRTSGVISKAYMQHAKYRTAHAASKTWIGSDGNVQGQISRHNKESWRAAEYMRMELLSKINARQGRLIGIDFVEATYTYKDIPYFIGLRGVMCRSWDIAAVQKAITAGTISISVLGQMVIA